MNKYIFEIKISKKIWGLTRLTGNIKFILEVTEIFLQ